jgi:hypothetical protein
MAIYSTLPAITTANPATLFGTATNSFPTFPAQYSTNSRLKPINNTLNHRASLSAYQTAPKTESVWLAETTRGFRWLQKELRLSPYRTISSSNDTANTQNIYQYNFNIGWGMRVQTTDLTANITNPIHQHENGDDMFYAPIFYNLGAGKSVTWHSSKYHAQPWGRFINQDLQLSFANSINSINGNGAAGLVLTGVTSLLVHVNIAGGGTNHQVPVNTPNTEDANVYYKLHFLDATTFAPKPLNFIRSGSSINMTSLANDYIMVTSIFYNLSDETIFDSSANSLLTKLTINNFNTDDRKLFKIDYNFTTANGVNPLTLVPSVIWDGNLDNPNIITNATPQVACNHIGLNKRIKFAQGLKWTVKVKTKDSSAYSKLSLSSTNKAIIQASLNYEKDFDQVDDNIYYHNLKTGKMSNLGVLADSLEDITNRAFLLNKVKTRSIERMDTFTDGRRFRYTNTNGHAFIHQVNVLDHSNDPFFNYSGSDRNIHFGMFIRNCAAVAKFDATFLATYKDRIDLLCASVANTSTDSNFVFSSQFDWLQFASPLSGIGDGSVDGTSGESQSEAMMMSVGIRDWGAVTNNQFLKDWGILMLSMEIDSYSKYRIVDPTTLPENRHHISTFYNTKKLSLISRIGEANTHLDSLYFYFGKNWQTQLVWGINWLAVAPTVQKLGQYVPNLGNLLSNYYDSPSNQMPIRYDVEVAGTTVTAGTNILVNIADVGSTTPLNNLTNQLKINVGAGVGMTDIFANDGNNLSKTLSLTDNTVYDVISANVTGAKIRVFTKPFYKANDWEWAIRSDAIRAITSSNQLAIFNKVKNLSKSTFTFDPNNALESPTLLLAMLANQMDDNVEFNSTNITNNPTSLSFKSVFDADNYLVEILNSTNTVIQSSTITNEEYNSNTLDYTKTITGLANNQLYTMRVTAKNSNNNLGTPQSFSFTLGTPNNPLGGTKDIRIVIL